MGGSGSGNFKSHDSAGRSKMPKGKKMEKHLLVGMTPIEYETFLEIAGNTLSDKFRALLNFYILKS